MIKTIEEFQKILPWLASLPFAPKIIISLVIILLCAFILLMMWHNPSNSSQISSTTQAIDQWNLACKESQKTQMLTPQKPLPTNLNKLRGDFERWWQQTPVELKHKLNAVVLYNALSCTTKTYRIQEDTSTRKTNSLYWAKQARDYFYETQDKIHYTESLLDLGAIYYDLSQIEHTDPDIFKQNVKKGDIVLEEASKNAASDQADDVLRIWSKFYYNLARPSSGRLQEDWDNNYLMLSFQKMEKAYKLKPQNSKNIIQLARITQKTASNPPFDTDPEWDKKIEEVHINLVNWWEDNGKDRKGAVERIPPLNILGVMALDLVKRSLFQNLTDNNTETLTKFENLLENIAIPAQRECLALLPHTEWKREYDFDMNYDLGRMTFYLHKIKQKLHQTYDGSYFNDGLKLMERAREKSSGIQREAAFKSLETDPSFKVLSTQELEKIKLIFSISS